MPHSFVHRPRTGSEHHRHTPSIPGRRRSSYGMSAGPPCRLRLKFGANIANQHSSLWARRTYCSRATHRYGRRTDESHRKALGRGNTLSELASPQSEPSHRRRSSFGTLNRTRRIHEKDQRSLPRTTTSDLVTSVRAVQVSVTALVRADDLALENIVLQWSSSYGTDVPDCWRKQSRSHGKQRCSSALKLWT